MECPCCQYRVTPTERVALLVSEFFHCPNCGYCLTEDARIQAEQAQYYRRDGIRCKGRSGGNGRSIKDKEREA